MHKFWKELVSRERVYDLRYYIAGYLSLFLMVLTSVFSPGSYLQTSLLTGLNSSADVFDGTVVPFCKGIVAPQAYYSDYRGSNWDEIPDSVKISQLDYDYQALRNGTASNDSLRLYSVPYGAAYASPMQDGSHIADDIIQPEGTPICAVANGQVVKSVVRDQGCGNTVVIRHDGVAGEAVYSGYCHNAKNLVAEGEWVKKGTVIATVGNTGISSTPHLHFQIDTEDAPFHPYWPFTFADASNADLDFFEAVNAGLKRELGLKHTLPAMDFVNRWLSEDVPVVGQNVEAVDIALNGSADNEKSIAVKNDSDQKEFEEPTSTRSDRQATLISFDANYSVLEIDMPEDVRVGQEYTMQIRQTADIKKALLTDTLRIYAEGADIDFIGERKLKYEDFVDGVAEVRFSPVESGRFQITVRNNVIVAHSELRVASLFADVAFTDSLYPVYEELVRDGIIAGYSDGTLRPDAEVKRVEAVKLVIEGLNKVDNDVYGRVAYLDTDLNTWYEQYLVAACHQDIACGDPDGYFRPADGVTIAELTKMILVALDEDIDLLVGDKQASYADLVPQDKWFTDYLIAGVALGIVDREALIDLEKPLSRAQIAQMILKSRQL